MKNGDFSFGGLGNQIFYPTTTRQLANGNWVRDPFPGNIVPLSRFDPVAQKVLQLDPWKAPNNPGTVNSDGPVDNLLFDEKSRTFFEDYSGRIDQQFSSKFKIYWSYTYNHESGLGDRKSTRLNSSHRCISYAVFCLKKKK